MSGGAYFGTTGSYVIGVDVSHSGDFTSVSVIHAPTGIICYTGPLHGWKHERARMREEMLRARAAFN